MVRILSIFWVKDSSAEEEEEGLEEGRLREFMQVMFQKKETSAMWEFRGWRISRRWPMYWSVLG